MRICLITTAPGHPLLAAVTELLSARHQVVTLDPGTVRMPPAEPGRPPGLGASEPFADVALLKSRTPQATSIAAWLEERGVPVLNSASATVLCQDRTKMAALSDCAGLPFAATRTLSSPAELAREGKPLGPLVVKSRHSRSDDLVAKADDEAAIWELAAAWPEEPVVVQEFTENSGWDHKLWAVGGRLFAGLRRSELSPDAPVLPESPVLPGSPDGRTHPLAVPDLPEGWAELVLRVGEVFGLDIYGVDILDTGGGKPLIVDINAFPGIRGQPGAPEAVADLALGTATAAGLAGGVRPPASTPTRGRAR